jgi:hypothetical protein
MTPLNTFTKRERLILRCIHLVFSIPILGYVYSPIEKIPDYAFPARFIFLPALVLSGLFMWKGHVIRRLLSKRSAQQDATDNQTQDIANKVK